MHFDQDRPRLQYRGSPRSRAQALIVKTLTVAGAGVMLLSVIAISLVLFAIAVTGIAVLGVYLWWKMRRVRKDMRSGLEDDAVIDGVVLRRVEISRIEER